jgi:hypothetical protein
MSGEVQAPSTSAEEFASFLSNALDFYSFRSIDIAPPGAEHLDILQSKFGHKAFKPFDARVFLW